MKKAILCIIPLLLLAGAGRETDYRVLKNAASLHKHVGAKICIEGKISQTPWQHMVGSFKGYPEVYYFDVADYQIMIYSRDPVRCAGSVRVYGMVVKISGRSKRPGSDDDTYSEYHLTVDRWECE